VRKGAVFFYGAVSGNAAKDPSEFPHAYLIFYLNSFICWSRFLEQKVRELLNCRLLVHDFPNAVAQLFLVGYQISPSQAVVIVFHLISWLTRLGAASWEIPFFPCPGYITAWLSPGCCLSQQVLCLWLFLPRDLPGFGRAVFSPCFHADFMPIKLANVWNPLEGGLFLTKT